MTVEAAMPVGGPGEIGSGWEPFSGGRRLFPLRPLLEVTGLSLRALAVTVGVAAPTVRRAAVRGLSEERADRWAVRVGLHPGEVWPDWWEQAVG